ncbi:MAG: tetratricopeptide repeat protein [Planctomycetes bacterium]|nr:tetratricopeptide repeat protein [Planctomycetota bacterium]
MATPDDLYREHEKLKTEGKYEEAVAKLEEALQQDADFVDAHLALAVLLQKIGRHEEGVQHGERACQIDPNEPFNFTALSVTYQRAWQATQDQIYIRKAEDAKAQADMLEMRR